MSQVKSITLAYLANSFLDTVSPARCLGCLTANTWLCDQCWRDFYPTPLRCIVCRQEKSRARTCAKCRRQSNLAGVISAGSYESLLLRRGIQWLKFKGIKAVADPLVHLMLPRLNIISPLHHLQQEAALVPVPLHRQRQLTRGFNQSLELCQQLNQKLNIPIYDITVRLRRTWTQSKLPSNLRSNNVKDAFKLKDSFLTRQTSPTKLIIVDDVTTTGSTLNAVAQPLKQLNPPEIWGLTVAHG